VGGLLGTMLGAFPKIFFTMFIVIDPLGAVPLYIGLTTGVDPARRGAIIRRAVLVALGVLIAFTVMGRPLLALLHIEPAAFFVSGGVMLFIVSLEMLFGRPTRSKVSEREGTAGDGGDADTGPDVAVFPLAIPMLAGPGSITTILLFTGGDDPWAMTVVLTLSIGAILGIVAAALRAGGLILRVLGGTGVSVFERIMGLLLSGMSVQFVLDGLRLLGVLGS